MKRLSSSNMYPLSIKQWSPWAGCDYHCSYCKPSFQRMLKRFSKCRLCQDYKPHMHPDRLNMHLPKTGYMQFIFCCSTGDISFCPSPYLVAILNVIKKNPDKTFLIQSKNPITFARVKFPNNVILGTTIETNRDIPTRISKALPPHYRYIDFLQIKHEPKMVTIEPIMRFDLPVMIGWIEQLRPALVWMGYDSKNCGLPEPTIEEFKALHWELAKRGFTVMLKTVKD